MLLIPWVQNSTVAAKMVLSSSLSATMTEISQPDESQAQRHRKRSDNPRLGIVGGGQLAKMTALAALELGCEVVVLERNNYSPAARLATETLVGDWNDPEALVKLASQVDAVTIENEFINADGLAAIERCGHVLLPRTATLRLIQDKFIQKQTLANAGLAVPQYRAVASMHDLALAGSELGWPLVLKKRRNSYDGKGNYTVRSEAGCSEGWNHLDGDRNQLYAEAFCPFEHELAIIITRAIGGAMAVYPVVETIQRNHICHVVKAPAEIPASIASEAAELAKRAIETIDGVGSFGVEMFLTREGNVLLNELAPRVHNSGHYTIEGCSCSQFENHVRAVLDWPLGSSKTVAPAVVMVNLLGAGKGPGWPAGVEDALNVHGAHIHIYGKAVSTKGRKMGHVTALGSSINEAEAVAQRAAASIIFGEPS